MPNRISSGMQYLTSTYNIDHAMTRLNDLQNQISSGKLYQTGDQDPASYTQALALEQTQSEYTQYDHTAQTVSDSLTNYGASVHSLSAIVSSARTIAEQGANGTQDATSRAVLANQVDQLLQQTIQIANTQQNGQYIYGGTANGTEAYTPVETSGGVVTSVTFNGDARTQSATLDSGSSIEFTVSGAAVFGNNPNSPTALMGALIKLRDDIRAGNPNYPNTATTTYDASTVSSDITAFTGISDTLGSVQGEIGARLTHLSNLKQLRTTYENTLKTQLSNVQDVDLTKAASDLAQQELSYQGALTVASRLQRNSLLELMK